MSGDTAEFYFLEMNTRLQVEHPVTEAVTGVDLVRAQLLVAAGHPLPWRQEDLRQRGHAIECRIYAEDPAHDFLPQAGRLLLYRQPVRPGIRVDAGVEEGSVVPVHYDPLLAKLVAHAETRELALARAVAALREFPILGIRTNLPFLVRLLNHAAVRSGDIDTWFLDQAGADLAAQHIRLKPDPTTQRGQDAEEEGGLSSGRSRVDVSGRLALNDRIAAAAVAAAAVHEEDVRERETGRAPAGADPWATIKRR